MSDKWLLRELALIRKRVRKIKLTRGYVGFEEDDLFQGAIEMMLKRGKIDHKYTRYALLDYVRSIYGRTDGAYYEARKGLMTNLFEEVFPSPSYADMGEIETKIALDSLFKNETGRNLEIINCLREGYTNEEAAIQLGVSRRAVWQRILNMKLKLRKRKTK